MINSITFATRLKIIMEYYDLSASAFSDKIDFNRSTISHLLSGRNKPSLEFVMKVLEYFPEVSFTWLLYGKGAFPSDSTQEKFSFPTTTPKAGLLPVEKSTEEKEKSTPVFKENKNEKTHIEENQGKKIKKIVFFYTDGSFESFEN